MATDISIRVLTKSRGNLGERRLTGGPYQLTIAVPMHVTVGRKGDLNVGDQDARGAATDADEDGSAVQSGLSNLQGRRHDET